MKMSKNVLIITGDAVEALEVFYPYYRCIEENINCTIASPVKKSLQTVVHDFYLKWKRLQKNGDIKLNLMPRLMRLNLLIMTHLLFLGPCS